MIVGISHSAEMMRKFVSRVNPGKPALIGGEPGVGKTLLAMKIIESYYPNIRYPFEKIIFYDYLSTNNINDNIVITTDEEIYKELSEKIPQKIWITPLRERIEDIPVLLEYMIARYNGPDLWYKKDNINKLVSYWWPFNIAEFKRVVTAKDGMKMLPYSKLKEILKMFSATKIVAEKMDSFWSDLSKYMSPGKFYHLFLESIDREFIKSALKNCKGSRVKTAELLDIHRNTLNQKIKKYNIKVKKT